MKNLTLTYRRNQKQFVVPEAVAVTLGWRQNKTYIGSIASSAACLLTHVNRAIVNFEPLITLPYRVNPILWPVIVIPWQAYEPAHARISNNYFDVQGFASFDPESVRWTDKFWDRLKSEIILSDSEEEVECGLD